MRHPEEFVSELTNTEMGPELQTVNPFAEIKKQSEEALAAILSIVPDSSVAKKKLFWTDPMCNMKNPGFIQ